MTTRSFIDHFGDVVEVPEPRKPFDHSGYERAATIADPDEPIPMKFIGGPGDGKFNAVHPKADHASVHVMDPAAMVIKPPFANKFDLPDLKVEVYRKEYFVEKGIELAFMVHQTMPADAAEAGIRNFLLNGPANEVNEVRAYGARRTLVTVANRWGNDMNTKLAEELFDSSGREFPADAFALSATDVEKLRFSNPFQSFAPGFKTQTIHWPGDP